MGRPSAASLTVVPLVGVVRRIEPPAGLSVPQAELWNAVVNAKPAEWFSDENAPLLSEYVRASDMCNRLAEKIEAMTASEDADLAAVKELLKMRDMESRRAVSIGTKLRLTQQSRYTPGAAGTAKKRAGLTRPWQ